MNSIIFTDSAKLEISSSEFANSTVVNIIDPNFYLDDSYFSKLIEDHLSNIKYDSIFLPLSFGQSLIDYIGLRFALHIKTHQSINQTTNLFIFGTETIDCLLRNEFFPVLQIKGVSLIDYNLKVIHDISLSLKSKLSKELLFNELKNISIPLPDYLYGNHSIANILGAKRLAEVTGNSIILDDYIHQHKKLEALNNDIYLKLILSHNYNNSLSSYQKLVINSKDKNILLIDDESIKGWGVVVKEILHGAILDVVELEPRDTFLDRALAKSLIKNNDLPFWDLILLDLRLLENEDKGDFANKTAIDYSGAQLLKKIKKENRGTQIIMFSATNKAWNMKELEELGADGFYFKESPEYYSDQNFSSNNYKSFSDQVSLCFKRAYLKQVFNILKPIELLCETECNKKAKNYNLLINQGTLIKINDQIIVFKKLLLDYPFELKWAFITLILIIEEIINESYYDDGDSQVVTINMLSNVKCNYIKNGERHLALTPVKFGSSFLSGEYKILNKDELSVFGTRDVRIPFNYRLSCLLHFKYNKPLDNSIFDFFPLYKLRSESVAHAGNKSVLDKDIYSALNLLAILIN